MSEVKHITSADALALRRWTDTIIRNASDEDGRNFDPRMAKMMGQLSALAFESRRALYMAAAQFQGGHSEGGMLIAKLLGVPFPLRMPALVTSATLEGMEPKELWPWLGQARRELPRRVGHCPGCKTDFFNGPPKVCRYCSGNILELTHDDWIVWRGGPCPLPSRKLVQIRQRGTEVESVIEAGKVNWTYHEMQTAEDIIAYRLMDETQAKAAS